MAYVLITIVKGCKYWVGRDLKLNGLINNAARVASAEEARSLKVIAQKNIHLDLFIEEVLPKAE